MLGYMAHARSAGFCPLQRPLLTWTAARCRVLLLRPTRAGCCAAAVCADLDCRLLLSIDREKDSDDAMATVELAAQLRDQGVVGVALTGGRCGPLGP